MGADFGELGDAAFGHDTGGFGGNDAGFALSEPPDAQLFGIGFGGGFLEKTFAEPADDVGLQGNSIIRAAIANGNSITKYP